MVGRFTTPAAAVTGLWLLLPPAWPASFDYTSLTAGPADRTGFTCVVESALARAKVFAGGADPGRDDLRRAVIELAEEGLDVECPSERQRDAAELADVESVEITLLMVLARAGRLGSVRVTPGPLYSDVDAWRLAESVLDEWADVAVLRSPQERAPSIFRIDRAVSDGNAVTAWVVASPAAICDEDPPDATLSRQGVPVSTCRLDTGSVKAECKVAVSSRTLGAQVRLVCDDPVPNGRVVLGWAQVPPTPVRRGGPDFVAILDPDERWREATSLARSDTRRGGFLDDLGAHGLALPTVDDDASVEVDLSQRDRIEIRARGTDCPLDETGTTSPFLEESGPFSFSGIRIEGSPPQIKVFERCVSVGVPPSALSHPRRGGTYEATTLYATMRAISWASRCVSTDCRTPPSFTITESRAWPLLDRDELDAAVGQTRRLRDAAGIFLVAVSLCLVALAYARRVRRR